MKKLFLALYFVSSFSFAHNEISTNHSECLSSSSLGAFQHISNEINKNDSRPSAKTINVEDMQIYFVTPEEEVINSVPPQLLALYLLKIIDVVNTSFDYTSVQDYLAIQMTINEKQQNFKVAYKKVPNKEEKIIIQTIEKELKKLPRLPVIKPIQLQLVFVINTKKNFI